MVGIKDLAAGIKGRVQFSEIEGLAYKKRDPAYFDNALGRSLQMGVIDWRSCIGRAGTFFTSNGDEDFGEVLSRYASNTLLKTTVARAAELRATAGDRTQWFSERNFRNLGAVSSAAFDVLDTAIKQNMITGDYPTGGADYPWPSTTGTPRPPRTVAPPVPAPAATPITAFAEDISIPPRPNVGGSPGRHGTAADTHSSSTPMDTGRSTHPAAEGSRKTIAPITPPPQGTKTLETTTSSGTKNTKFVVFAVVAVMFSGLVLAPGDMRGIILALYIKCALYAGIVFGVFRLIRSGGFLKYTGAAILVLLLLTSCVSNLFQGLRLSAAGL